MVEMPMLPYITLIAFLALMCGIGGSRGNPKPILSKWISLIVLALFSGLRYQTGYDWMPYTELFEGIPNVWNEGFLTLQLTNLPPMELGYVAFNFLVRVLGLSVDYIFLGCAFFNIFALNRLLGSFRCNVPIAIIFHVGFCFIFFYFSTIRQGCAVGFVLLACREMILTRRLYIIMLYFVVSLSFHVSAIIYLPILLMAYYKININVFASSLIVICVGVTSSYYDLTGSLFNFIVQQFGSAFFDKFYVYTQTEHESSLATFGLLGLNLLSLTYISRNSVAQIETISRLAILSAMALVLLILTFPNNTSVWSRMFMFSATMQGFWYAVHCSIAPLWKARTVSVTCVSLSVFIFMFNLSRNTDFMVPYQTIIDRDYGTVDTNNEFLTLRLYHGDF